MKGERGSAAPLLVAGGALLVAGAAAAGAMVAASATHIRADGAADTAALAGAAALFDARGPCAAAGRIAAANSAELLSCSAAGAVVTVRVAVEPPAVLVRLTGEQRVAAVAAAEMVWTDGTAPPAPAGSDSWEQG